MKINSFMRVVGLPIWVDFIDQPRYSGIRVNRGRYSIVVESHNGQRIS